MLKNSTCPITHEEMLVPVIADDCLTYEFTAIAKWLLENNGSNPLRRSATVSVLILNNVARDHDTLLSAEDKMQIAQYLKKLTEHFPNLNVVGIDQIEDIAALIAALNPTMHNNKIKAKLLAAVDEQDVSGVTYLLSELTGPSPGKYCYEALNKSIILDNREMAQLFLAIPGIDLEYLVPPAIHHDRAQILRDLLTAERMPERYIFNHKNSLLQLADMYDAFDAMEVILHELRVDPNQLSSKNVNGYSLSMFYKAVQAGLLSLTQAFLANDKLDLYLDGDYQHTPLYRAKICGDHRVFNLLLDRYIKCFCNSPDLMANEFNRNPSSFDNLHKHRDELWDRLRTEIKSSMSDINYFNFIKQISQPKQLANRENHPLYTIFSHPTWGFSMFTERNIIKEIQAEISIINDSFNLALS